jgi:vacuolar iron transporter family protein
MKNTLKKYISEIVYGGNDGIITTLATVAGFTGAYGGNLLGQAGPKILLLFAIANLFADGASMGVGSLLSNLAQDDVQKSPHTSQTYKRAGATILSFVLFGSFPILPYIFGLYDYTFSLAMLSTVFAMVLLALTRYWLTQKHLFKTLVQNLSLGLLASSIAFFVGLFFKI